MKILHTSDWHLGRALYGRKRYNEFEQFLDWLVNCIKEKNIDALLVAGDIFDNGTPSNRAQELYYEFLCCVARSECRHVVIVAGNHDSPSFLNAPKQMLRFLNIHVAVCAADFLEDEVLVLKNNKNEPEIIVCAIPYLRDRDIRRVEPGESMDDKARNLVKGIRDHYWQVCDNAEKKREAIGKNIPIVATGHLFAAGGRVVEGDGVRDLYVGGLGHVRADIFPECIDYLALGHLHSPQMIKKNKTRRYSGSPLPMSFGEANQQKLVIAVDFSHKTPEIEEIPVPCFQALETIKGNLETIKKRIDVLKNDKAPIWLEIIYDGEAIVGRLQEDIFEMVKDFNLEILCIKNTGLAAQTLCQMKIGETLDDLSVEDVFVRRIENAKVPKEQHAQLTGAFRQIMTALLEEDKQAQ